MQKRRNIYRRVKPKIIKSKLKRLFDISLTLLFFITVFAGVFLLQSEPDPQPILTGKPRIIDGDTLSLGSNRIRLQGIDAPELSQRCHKGDKDYACGQSSKHALQTEIAGATIRCETHGTDRYQRLLARCYLGQKDINAFMVAQGWAVSYGAYKAEEKDAHDNARGIWEGEFERPHIWRKDKALESDAPELFSKLSDVIADWIHYIKIEITGLF